MNRIALKELSQIRFGLHCQSGNQGTYNYIQAKYFNEFGNIITKDNCFADISDKDFSHILKDGDVLFISKGFRYFAWCYRETFGPAVASSIFFVLSPDQQIILPEYLTTYFNMPNSQEYFKQFGAGSSIPSIRKSELGDILIPVLPFEMQHKLVELDRLHTQDISLANNLILQKNILFQSVISNLLK